jgi:hypothetical protein
VSDDPMKAKKLCGAKTRSGTSCRKPGDPRCRLHGGAAPQVIAKRERERAEQAARDQVAVLLDDPTAEPIRDPQEKLAALAGRIEHAVDVVGVRVSELASLGIVTGAGGQQIRAEVRVWTELIGHLTRSLDILIRAGYAERRLELAEREAELYGQLVAAALDAAQVTGEDRARGLAAARERFVLVTGGAA